MSELVRARLENGMEKTVDRGFAEANGLEILDEPARGRNGQLRPVTRTGGRPIKPHTTVDEAAAAKNSPDQTQNDPDSPIGETPQGSATDPSTPEEAPQ